MSTRSKPVGLSSNNSKELYLRKGSLQLSCRYESLEKGKVRYLYQICREKSTRTFGLIGPVRSTWQNLFQSPKEYCYSYTPEQLQSLRLWQK